MSFYFFSTWQFLHACKTMSASSFQRPVDESAQLGEVMIGQTELESCVWGRTTDLSRCHHSSLTMFSWASLHSHIFWLPQAALRAEKQRGLWYDYLLSLLVRIYTKHKTNTFPLEDNQNQSHGSAV